MISGVRLSQLRIITTSNGAVLHMVKQTDQMFAGFGEIYFSRIAGGQRKDWRRHRIATAQISVPVGRVRFALYDDRPNSKTSGVSWDVILGEANYQLLTIPPSIWFAFRNESPDNSLIANCSSTPHDVTQIDRQDCDTSTIPYLWRS